MNIIMKSTKGLYPCLIKITRYIQREDICNKKMVFYQFILKGFPKMCLLYQYNVCLKNLHHIFLGWHHLYFRGSVYVLLFIRPSVHQSNQMRFSNLKMEEDLFFCKYTRPQLFC